MAEKNDKTFTQTAPPLRVASERKSKLHEGLIIVTTSLTIKIQEDLKTAMKRGEQSVSLSTTPYNRRDETKEIDSRKVLTDSEAVVILNRLSKQRKDSISQYLAASRTDLASVEEHELKIIEVIYPSNCQPRK